ncbi:MAG: T9SS type A sorting domain-containing protein [Flavobacteriales bacterium]|nr:T9SS type A sorting domain-containing protein [Flavobacteriales bacterium]
MKKIYLSAAILAFGGSLIAQAPTTQRAMFSTKKIKKEAEAPLQNKALGVAYPVSDFSTPGYWVLDNAGEMAPMGWTIDAVNDSWAFGSSIASTSGGNFLELYNGDPTTGSPAPSNSTFTATTAASIDIPTLTGGTSDVTIQFEQYGALFVDMQEVQVSTDGTTFVTVGDNSDITPLTSTGGDPYPNPMLRTYDISGAIAGNPSTVWIRFSWSPGAQNITYGWFVDDVNIVTKPNNDIKTGDNDWGSLGLHYHQIPLTQVAPIDFWTNVSNEGSDAQTGVTLNVDVNSGANTGSSAGVTVAPSASDSLVVNGLFTPSATGNYSFTMDITADLVDDVPANNQLTGDSFIVNDYIYARDTDGTPSPGGGEDGGTPGDFAFEAGSYFDAFAAEQVYGINVTIGSGTPDGTIIYGKLYEFDAAAGDFVYVDETAEYATVATDIGTEKTLVLFTYPTLTAGNTYLVMVGCYSEFYYGTSGFSPDQTSFITYGGWGGTGSQYYTNGTPMVRMNFDPSIGIEEVSQTGDILGQNMPNPFDNNSTINFELKNTSDVQFEFVDMTGKIVKTMDLGTLVNGPHSIQVDATEFASGVYYYSLVSEGSKITSKMIVQK